MAKITLVATGGARAVTHLELAERFLADGHQVRCIATRAAGRFIASHLIGRPSRLFLYAQLYRTHVRERVAYFGDTPARVPHVNEARWPDVVVMAPATCNSIGKLVAGINDNFPLLVLRAIPRTKRVIVIPSMNPEMWYDPQFQRNVDLLNATEKYRVICPTRGEMLSGDFGFGAQVPFEDIVTETYRALGIISDAADAALGARATAPRWSQHEGVANDEERPRVVLVDEDRILRDEIAVALARAHPDLRVEQFDNASQTLLWAREQQVALVVTELAFTDGASGFDLIDHFRRPGSQTSVHIIATSRRDRRESGAERLSHREVLFQPKPLNVPFVVGMIAGCLGSARTAGTHVVRRHLHAGEVLFCEGDPGSHVFVVESGRLNVVRQRNGSQVTLGKIEERGIVGEMAFLGDLIRSATVIADVDSDVIELDLDDMRTYLENQPSWLQALIQSLTGHIRRRDASSLRLHVSETERDSRGETTAPPVPWRDRPLQK